jgi:hypothetical protein
MQHFSNSDGDDFQVILPIPDERNSDIIFFFEKMYDFRLRPQFQEYMTMAFKNKWRWAIMTQTILKPYPYDSTNKFMVNEWAVKFNFESAEDAILFKLTWFK